jgi:hypothetical protein
VLGHFVNEVGRPVVVVLVRLWYVEVLHMSEDPVGARPEQIQRRDRLTCSAKMFIISKLSVGGSLSMVEPLRAWAESNGNVTEEPAAGL